MSLKSGRTRASDTLPMTVTIAGATLLGALRPGTIDNGVLAAGNCRVHLLLHEDRALLATKLGEYPDGTLALKLVALVGVPSGPLADFAINRAGLRGTRFAGRKLRADRATMVGELSDGASASLLPAAAGLVALAVLAPSTHTAVNRAFVLATLAGSLHRRALAAAVCSSSDEGAMAGLGASATGLGALAPLAEDAGTAVTRAGLRVAGAGLSEGVAGLAAILGEANNLAVSVGLATATGLGADSPGSEARNLAVNRAPLSVAGGSLKEGRALNSSMSGLSDNGAVGSLAAAVACLGTEPPDTPLGNLAVDWADAAVAGGSSDEAAACGTAKARLGGDLASLELSAHAAGHRALAHGTPSGQLTVDRAWLVVAVAVLPLERTLLASVSRGAKNLAVVGLRALSCRTEDGARLGTSRPRTPRSHDAVHRALLGFAFLLFDECGTGVATVLALANDLTSAAGSTNTTGMRADGPTRPARNPAMDWAHTGGARALLLQSGAGLATITSRGEDFANALLITLAAGLVASRPSPPLLHDAINGASLFVASNLLGHDTTEKATKLGLSDNLTGACHRSTATGHSARTVFGPSRKLAMNGARVGLALALVEEVGANHTSGSSFASDSALASLVAATAGLGAGSPLGPSRNGAVNRARALLALTSLTGGSGTLLAAISSRGHNDTSAKLAASAAGLGALAVRAPGRNDAVDGALAGVALLGLVKPRALVTTPLRVHSNLAGAGLHAATTGSSALGVLGPSRNFAVKRAAAGVAADHFFEHAARFATECSLLGDLAGTSLETSTTGDAAFGVRLPGSVLAVNGAGLRVAFSRLLCGEAFPTIVSLGDNLADAKVTATATALGATSPAAPLGHDAVNLFGVGDVVDLPLVVEGKSGGLSVVKVHTELLRGSLVYGTSTSDHPVMAIALQGSDVGRRFSVVALGGIHVDE